jgi:hypothetical protein
MSTGLECLFVERNIGEWYYILEHWDAPKAAFDWLDYATAYGPFNSEEKARTDLYNNHPNPGGSSMIKRDHYEKFSDSQKEKYEGLIRHPSCPVMLFRTASHGK